MQCVPEVMYCLCLLQLNYEVNVTAGAKKAARKAHFVAIILGQMAFSGTTFICAPFYTQFCFYLNVDFLNLFSCLFPCYPFSATLFNTLHFIIRNP